MSSPDPAHSEEFPWGLAPAHLKTRRQLRAAGRSPGHEPVARMVRTRRGRTFFAHLFDLGKTTPKRTATPAQLEAVAKAVRERQLRAAERRGLTRSEMAAPVVPAPGWEQTPTRSQEGNPMSDSTTQIDEGKTLSQLVKGRDLKGWGIANSAYAEMVRQGYDPARLTEMVRDCQTGRQATLLMNELAKKEPREVAPAPAPEPVTQPEQPAAAARPTSHMQAMEYLRVTVALDDARGRRDRLERATRELADIAPDSPEAQALSQEIADSRAVAEQRLSDGTRGHGPEASAQVLADALVWREDSVLAADAVSLIAHEYAALEGLRIDTENLTVAVDPAFAAAATQRIMQFQVMADRASAVRTALHEMGAPEHVLNAVGTWQATAVPEQVLNAVVAWQATEPPVEGLQDYIDGEPDRRAQLRQDLASAGLRPQVRAAVDSMIDYVRGDIADLTDTPILVSPAEEVRGRIPALLAEFARRGKEFAPIMAAEIQPMTPADQEKVRDAGREIVKGNDVDPHQLWPGWVDRDALAERIKSFATESTVARGYAEGLAAGEVNGVKGNIGPVLSEVRTARHDIHGMLAGEGLHPVEKAHVLGVLADIDAGRVTALPEVLFLDERSKKAVDLHRHHVEAGRISSQAVADTAAMLGAAAPRALEQLAAVGSDIDKVARGQYAPSDVPTLRNVYARHMGKLGEAVADTGMNVPTKMKMRATLDAAARVAGQHGGGLADRTKQWDNRIRAGAAFSARQADAAAGRAAAQASHAHTPQRACTARPAPSASQPSTNGPGARVSRLHHEEIGR